jgi:glycine cleavage system H protein
VKTAADVYAPVTGEITAHNENVKGDPALVNNEAEKDGWVLKVHVEDAKDLDGLMDEKAYSKFCEENKH